MTTLTDAMNRLPKERRAKIEARAEALIAEEMTLRDLKKSQNQTQEWTIRAQRRKIDHGQTPPKK